MIFLQLLHGSGADNGARNEWTAAQESQRHLCRGESVLCSQLHISRHSARDVRFLRALPKFRKQGDPPMFSWIPGIFSCQPTKCKRTICQQADLFAITHFMQAAFKAAVDQVVSVLDRDNALQPHTLCDFKELGHAPRRFIAQADVAHLAAFHWKLLRSQISWM